MSKEAQLQELPVAKIKPAKDNPRSSVGDVAELAASIESSGVIEPLIVMQRNGGYDVVAGHRRLAGAKKAGLKTVPAIVREFTEQERQEAMLIENLQREDLTVLEEARAYARLVELGLSQRELARRVGRNQSHISKRLALLELPANVTKEIDAGGITIEEALELTKLAEHPQRLAEAFKESKRHFNGIRGAVKSQLDDLELDQKINRNRTALQKKGVKLVELKIDSLYYDPRLPSGAVVVKKGAWDGIDMDPKKHEAFDCHRAAVHPRSGEIVYACAKPGEHAKLARGSAANKARSADKSDDVKAKERADREKEKAGQLRARERNIELGKTLERELAKPKIDAENMRIVADLLVHQIGDDLGLRGLRLVDESTQTVVRKKDESISRVVHEHTSSGAKDLVRKKLAQAKTAPEIMGVLLQLFVASRRAELDALPPSQRFGEVRGLTSWSDDYGLCKPAVASVEAIATRIGLAKKKGRR